MEDTNKILADTGTIEEMYNRLAALRKREENLKQMIINDALSRAKFKAGDVVVIVTPAHKDYWINKVVPETRKYGRVEFVGVVIDKYGVPGVSLRYEIAPPTKNGFHKGNRITVVSGDSKGTYLETYDGPIVSSISPDSFWVFKALKALKDDAA